MIRETIKLLSRAIITWIFVILFVAVQAQKGEKSISAGPLISFPLDKYIIPSYQTGVGLEAIGQYNFSKKSALLLQLGLASYGIRDGYSNGSNRIQIFSLNGGYKYQFTSSGFFTNVLLGIDRESGDGFISFTLGAGKRFTFKDGYFIDAGIDYVGGDIERRLNIKVIFSLLRRP